MHTCFHHSCRTESPLKLIIILSWDYYQPTYWFPSSRNHLVRYAHRLLLADGLCHCESLFGSSASKSIRLVGSQIGSWLGSFVGLLIDSSNQIKWFTRTWLPPTRLRLVNAFALLAQRKIVNSTKNFDRAVIAFSPFLFNASIDLNKYFKTQSVLLV